MSAAIEISEQDWWLLDEAVNAAMDLRDVGEEPTETEFQQILRNVAETRIADADECQRAVDRIEAFRPVLKALARPRGSA